MTVVTRFVLTGHFLMSLEAVQKLLKAVRRARPGGGNTLGGLIWDKIGVT